MVDVLAVTDDSLQVLEPSGDRTPIAKLSNGDESNDDGEADESGSKISLR